MPFIAVGNLDQNYEPEPVPEGAYDLRIISVAEERESKDGDTFYPVLIAVEDGEFPNASPVRHNLWLGVSENEEANQFRKRDLIRFLNMFSIDYTEAGFDDDDFPGQTSNAMLGQTEPNDDGDVYNELRLPRAPRG